MGPPAGFIASPGPECGDFRISLVELSLALLPRILIEVNVEILNIPERGGLCK